MALVELGREVARRDREAGMLPPLSTAQVEMLRSAGAPLPRRSEAKAS